MLNQNHFLIYASECAPKLTELDLIGILCESCEGNAKRDITGVLVHKSSQFLQILEGNKKNIVNLYLKIRNDKRHFGIQTFVLHGASERISNDFMSYKHADSPLQDEQYRRFFVANFDFKKLAEKPFLAYDFLRDLASTQQKNQDMLYKSMSRSHSNTQAAAISLDDIIRD